MHHRHFNENLFAFVFVVLNTVSALVSDIKAMSYTSMPATLSKGLPPPVPTVPPMARMPMVGGVVVPVATQQPPLQQMSIPAPPALTVKPRSTTAEGMYGAWE